MSTTIDDEPIPPAPDPDVRPDPAKLRGYWGDPADRPARQLWDPAAVEATPAEAQADAWAAERVPAVETPERSIPHEDVAQTRLGKPGHLTVPAHGIVGASESGPLVRVNDAGSPLDHLLAILLSLVGGLVASGLALAYLLRPGTHNGEPSLTWGLTPDLLKIAIALIFMGSIFLIMGSLIGRLAPGAWGWSALVAWVPLGLLAFKAIALLRPELAARIVEVPVVAEFAGRLPPISRQLLGLSGLQIVLLAAALLGGFWGASSGTGTSRASVAPRAAEDAEHASPMHDHGVHTSPTDHVVTRAPSEKAPAVRPARVADSEPRDERRPVGNRGYW